MIQFVQKRDGRVVPFEKEKITKAIEKAGLAAHEFGRETAEYLTNIVVQEIIFEKEPVNIEIIQNKIEEVLMRKGFYQTAKAFIIYREKRRELRELRKHLNIPELFDAYIGEETWEVHENANIDYSIQGLKAYITGKAEEIYWLEKVYPKKISDYHKDGFVHIHNLSFLGAYCVGWDLEDLIKRGFGGVPGKPYSSPAKHLSSILGQMMNFLFTLQNEAAGAVAFSSFDTLLAPFVYFDKLSYKEVKQQIQEFIYNMNQTMRTGGQSPFSNITVDLTPHPLLKDKPVIIGGKPIKEYTYGMFKKEMDLINKALFEVYIEGDGHGRPHSVSGDSMCLIKENGRMKLVRIGDFINALMEQNKSVHIENDNSEIMDVRDRSIETVGIRDGRIIFQKVNYIARHPVNSLLKIITDGGFSIKVTESHSVFVLKNGKIEDYKASELKEGDYLITPRILPTHSTNEHKEISLAEEFIKKGKSDGIYIRDVKKKDGKRLWKKIYCKNSIGHISVFPLSSIKDELPELDLSEAKISLAGSKLKISNNLKISDELIELLGWYSAEGSAEKSKNYGGISLGLNLKKEKDKAIYISELIKKIWPNVPVKIREIEKRNLIEIRVHSKLIRRIFTEIFELKKGRERKVPDIIFELPNRQKKIFLNAYFQGDGHISKDGLNITSISPQLIYGTSTLLKQLGIFHTISEYVNKGRKRFRINIWGDINFTDNHRSYTISKIPVKESGLLALIDKLLEKEPFYYDSLGRKYRNTKERILRNLGISPEVDSTEIENIRKVVNYLKKNGIDIPKTLIDILNDEMLFLKIKKIEQIETKNEMVYDFSTETENFIANNLLVHNTFPIPTLNVSKDFDWDNPVLEPVWEATAKYGTPYFANYVRSDLRPEDARSMCIDGNEEILIREEGIIKRLTLRDLVEGYKASEFDEDGWTEPKNHLEALSLNPKTMKMEWIPIKRFLKIKDSVGVKVTTDDGRTVSFSQKHPMAVYTGKGIQMRFAKDVKKGDKFLSLNDVNYTEDSKVNIVEVKQVELETFIEPKEFYDIELTKNHLFALANGLISFNCCRLRLETRELKSKGGGLFGANPLTGSTGVITINMPRIGYLAKSEEEFFSILDDIMDAAKEGLEKKRETVEKFTEMGLYPYSRIYLDSIKESTGHYWSNHFSTIGLIGMNEALMNFFGINVHMGTQKGIEFAVKVLEHMRNRLRKYQEETDHLFNLEATPAESTAYSLALKDKKLYPDIITAGTEENPYYTNSTQLPVGFTDDPFEVAALQEPVQKLYTGGCIEKGNKVLTDKGLLPIEYIVENFSHLKPIKALSYNKDKNISEWDEIVEAVKIDVSKENKIRVKGEKGLDIVTSDWHPFFVLEEIKPDTKCPVCGTKVNGIKGFAAHLRYNPTCREKYISMDKFRVVEKRADELKVGDYILQNSFNMYPDKESELDENLMWLIGFFIGNGSISKSIDNRGGNHLEKYRIRFFSESQRGLEKAASILNNYFGCFVNVIKNDKRSDALREVTTSKKEVIDFFFKYGFWAGEKVYDIYVPEKVKENITQKNVYAFISGLIDSHGTIGKREGDLEYDTVSERLANDILEIFTKAGILATKTLKKTKRENEKDIFRIRLPQYELTRIKEKLGIEANLDRVKNNFSDRVRRQLPVVRVKEISKVDVEDNEFYDLMTKNNHNYLAGKNCLVFVHNTVVHFFLGERLTNPNSAKIFVRKILENFEIPYITLTPSFSICPKHGYIPGEHEFCPYCDEELKEKARKGELENNKKSGKIDIDLKIDI